MGIGDRPWLLSFKALAASARPRPLLKPASASVPARLNRSTGAQPPGRTATLIASRLVTVSMASTTEPSGKRWVTMETKATRTMLHNVS
jgi:hypothetical protein